MYEWVKAFHLIAVISWMAGLFYLPRLYAYHVDNENMSQTFELMERRLLKIIMNPAMMASWAFGLILIFYFGVIDFSQVWIIIKLFMVFLMTVFHVYLSKVHNKLVSKIHNYNSSYFKKINEIPTFIMITVVILVTVRPF